MGYKETLERMHSGKVFYFEGEELMALQAACLDTLYDFNHTRPSEGEKRAELMKKVLAEAGEGCYIEPPLHANWGIHTHFGDHVYANFGLTLVDDTDIYVGSYVMMGPNVVLATAGHPVCPELRRKQAQFNLPVHIGENVWLGAGVIVLPGVTIGENSVIGAGSVVNKDVPEGVIAAGNPCRVIRKITEADKEKLKEGINAMNDAATGGMAVYTRRADDAEAKIK